MKLNCRLFLFAAILFGLLACSVQGGSSKSEQEKKEDLSEQILFLKTLLAQSNSEEGITKSNIALILAKDLKDTNSIDHIKFLKTKFYMKAGKLDSAIYAVMSIESEGANIVQYNTLLGGMLINLGSNSSALPYIKKMVESEKEKAIRFFHLNILGRVYMNLNNYDSTKHTFNRQLEIAKSLNSDHLYANALNNMGYAAKEFGVDDAAVKYFIEALNVIDGIVQKSKSDSIIYMMARSNLGNVYFDNKQYQEAIPHIKYYYDIISKVNSPTLDFRDPNETMASTGEQLCRSYLKLNQHQFAKNILDELKGKDTSEIFLIHIANIKYVYYYSIGQYELAFSEIDKIDELKEVLDREDDLATKDKDGYLGVLYMENAKNIGRIEKVKREKVEAEKAFIFKGSIFALGFSVVLILSLIVIYFQKKQKYKINRELLESEQKVISYALELKKRDIAKLALDTAHRSAWRKNLIEKLKKVSKMEREQMKVGVKEILLNLRAADSSRASVDKLRENIDLVNEYFYNNLSEKHPDLSKYDQEFCAYIKLGMSNKEIAIIKNISPDSVRTSKKRVKKRLGIQGEDMDRYIMSV